MAQRRMFSLEIVNTDSFLDMPASAQCLYFHLGMRADDDGFVGAPKRIAALVNCGLDDLRLLVSKGFIIAFPSGVIVITDWKSNNYIQKDRYRPTTYSVEMAQLQVVGGRYTILDTHCIQTVSKMDTQYRLELGKDSINNIYNTPPENPAVHVPKKDIKKTTKRKYGEYKHVLLNDDEIQKLNDEYGKSMTEKSIKFLDEYIEAKGYKHNNSYLTIKKWVVGAVRESQKKVSGRQFTAHRSNNRFCNFESRVYNYDEIEAKEQELIRRKAHDEGG